MRIAAVIPAFNEESAITQVVNDICLLRKTAGIDITAIVVNDCSLDRTAQIANNLDCILLDLPVNLGIGGAVQTGFKHAFRNGYDLALQIDGDGQHPPSEIPKLLAYRQQARLNVVIGSRFIEKEGFQSSAMRRMGIRYFQFLNSLYTGQTITDSTSGFRLIDRKALEIVNNHYPDEYPEPEAIVIYSFHGLKVGEVAVNMKERQGGVSSIGTFASVYYMFKVTLAMFFTFIRLKSKKT
jgi:glycosyltransferase involved in cell wall biosynthesis